jgi:hypothetical protein
VWIGGDGGAFADALTPVAANAALDSTFQAPDPGFGVVWAVLRMGVGWSAGETMRLGSISVTATTVPSIGTPQILQLGSGADIFVDAATGATITGASITPPANARVQVWLVTRRDEARTWDSVTSGFATVAGWSQVEGTEVEEPVGNFIRMDCWEATTTSSPGSGTITGTLSGTAYQRSIMGGAVTGVQSMVDSAIASNTTGPSVSATFSPAPQTGDVAFVGAVSRGDAAATGMTFDDGLTVADNGPLAQSSNFTVHFGQKPDPSATQGASSMVSNHSHIIISTLLRG